MLQILPSDALLESLGGFTSRTYFTGDWFMAYEWICRKLMQWKPEGPPFELLNATSSINNHGFNNIWGRETPGERIAYLLKHGWFRSEVNSFLAYLNINNWDDLAKPIFIKGRRPKEFPNHKWFELEGRILDYSPNSCHLKAIWVQGFSLQFSSYRKRWIANIHYGYPHDSSSWEISLEQNYREFLDTFAGRIQNWIDKVLKPDLSPGVRKEKEITWNRVYRAMRDLFWDNHSICDAEEQIADELVKIEGSTLTEGRMILNKQRLATLKKWAKQSLNNG